MLDLQIGNMGGIAVSIDLRLEAVGRTRSRHPRSCCCSTARRIEFLAKRADADAELVKPVDPATLRRVIDTLLGAGAVAADTTRETEPVEG